MEVGERKGIFRVKMAEKPVVTEKSVKKMFS